MSSVPKIIGDFTATESLFEPKDKGTAVDRRVAEIGMIFSHGAEGGLFTVIAKRK